MNRAERLRRLREQRLPGWLGVVSFVAPLLAWEYAAYKNGERVEYITPWTQRHKLTSAAFVVWFVDHVFLEGKGWQRMTRAGR